MVLSYPKKTSPRTRPTHHSRTRTNMTDPETLPTYDEATTTTSAPIPTTTTTTISPADAAELARLRAEEQERRDAAQSVPVPQADVDDLARLRADKQRQEGAVRVRQLFVTATAPPPPPPPPPPPTTTTMTRDTEAQLSRHCEVSGCERVGSWCCGLPLVAVLVFLVIVLPVILKRSR